MPNEESSKTEESLSKVNKVCRFISLIMKIVFALICIWWIFAAGLMGASLVNPDAFDSVENVSISGLLLFVAYGVVIGVCFVILIKIFSDTAKGRSPFTMLQVRRLKTISAMLIMYAVFDIAMKYNAVFLQFNNMNSGYASMDSVLTIDLAPIIVAAVVFAFSFVFKYGVLLQELSDETL